MGSPIRTAATAGTTAGGTGRGQGAGGPEPAGPIQTLPGPGLPVVPPVASQVCCWLGGVVCSAYWKCSCSVDMFARGWCAVGPGLTDAQRVVL